MVAGVEEEEEEGARVPVRVRGEWRRRIRMKGRMRMEGKEGRKGEEERDQREGQVRWCKTCLLGIPYDASGSCIHL